MKVKASIIAVVIIAYLVLLGWYFIPSLLATAPTTTLPQTGYAVQTTSCQPRRFESGNTPPKYVMLRFDDSIQDQWVNALPILQNYSFPAAFFALTSALQNKTIPNTVQYTWETMSWKEMQCLYNEGYDIVDHGSAENIMTNMTLQQLQTQVVNSRQALINHGITYVPDFGLPSGAGFQNSTVISYILNAGFKHVWAAYPPGQGISNYTTLKTIWYPIDVVDNDTSLAQFRAFTSHANSSFVVGFEFHQIFADPAYANASQPYSMTLNQFKEDMAWLYNNGYTVILPTFLPNYNIIAP